MAYLYDSNGKKLTISEQKAIDYDSIIKCINHRGWNSIAPENTLPAFILSHENGFKYVETDVCLTSDGVPVLLHDSTIDRTSDGSGSIASMTYEEVLQYDFGSWKSSDYTGTKIPTFEEFIALCRYIGLHPYVEVKHGAGFSEAQVQNLVNIAKKYSMADKISWISRSTTYLEYIKNYDSTARLIYSPDDITDASIATGITLKTGENEVVINVEYSNITEEKVALCITNGFPLETYVVDSESVVKSLNPYVTGVTSNNLKAGDIMYHQYNN